MSSAAQAYVLAVTPNRLARASVEILDASKRVTDAQRVDFQTIG
jgi:hypothetical protein